MTMPANTTKLTDLQVDGDVYDSNGNAVNVAALGVAASSQSTITVGAEAATAANCIRVTVQLKDANGVNLASRRYLRAWLSSSATTGAVATAPSAGTAVGTKGIILKEDTAELLFQCITDAAGALELDITDAGTPTMYLYVVLPNGSVKVSSAITFA